MKRPVRLSADQWTEVEVRRRNGESVAKLARAFNVSIRTLRMRFNSERSQTITSVAEQVIEAEVRFTELPVSAQISCKALINDLRAISANLAAAGKHGSQVSLRLAAQANEQSALISKDRAAADNEQSLRSVSAFIGVANKASEIGMNLLAANKDNKLKDQNDTLPEDMPAHVPDDAVEASQVYQRLISGGA